MRVLLVNPPIYDFTAFDYWLKPYGLMRVGGRLGRECEISVFDYMVSFQRDSWGRGRFPEELQPRPEVFRDLMRRFRRFGRPREEFRETLRRNSCDAVLVETGMTYWYPGVREVIEDVRRFRPEAKIVLGGIYATLCREHALGLGADLVISGDDLTPLRQLLPLRDSFLPFHLPSRRDVGDVAAMKLSAGCPFRCTYCSVPLLHRDFSTRPHEECLEEARMLSRSGVKHVAFYDDALLCKPEAALSPFLEGILRERLAFSFYTPNALHVRLLTEELARLMVRAGFRSFSLGFESESAHWLARTGPKGSAEEFTAAVARLRSAGAQSIIAYIIFGHPDAEEQEIEASMIRAHDAGARIMLSEFAPVPGTIDGERCRQWVDVDEPLNHNKTAFTLRRLGADRVKHFKNLCRELNRQPPPKGETQRRKDAEAQS